MVGFALKELPNLPSIFVPWLTPRLGRRGRLGLVTSDGDDHRRPSGPEGTAPGKAGFNSYAAQARKQRLKKAADALALNERGLTRADVATELGIAKDSLKALLRDARFCRSPDTDPTRQRLAQKAVEAVEAGISKAQVRVLENVSAVKASESWKDADVLYGAHGIRDVWKDE